MNNILSRIVFVSLTSLLMTLTLWETSTAQALQENGSVMGWIHNHISNDMPLEDSEAFVKPSALDLSRFRSVMDLVLLEAYNQIDDSLAAHFPSYEFVQVTDTSFENAQYYMLRENPVTKGWGTIIYNPNWQRNLTLAVPHPLHDSKTPYEGIDFLQYMGARLFVIAGTHRCANDEASLCDGTTTVCSATSSSEPYKVSDMAHNDSTVFQVVHEAMFEFSNQAWFLNIHGHASNDCEDVFLSNGRVDDPSTEMMALKDSLIANGVNAAYAGDGSVCGLTGTSNTQGRYVNGSSDPCGTSNVNNSGRFFHIEQFTSIRASQDKYRVLLEEIAEMIPKTNNTLTFPDFRDLSINEIHFYPIAPDGNANGLSGVQTVSDEFVEIVNSDENTFDLSGWSFSDNTEVRHIFPSGTKLVNGQALVLFGGSFTGDFKGSIVQTASTLALNLGNNKESIFLNAPTGAPIFSVSYDSSGTFFTGGSLVRSPEITGDFVYHKTADGVDNSWFSPGTQIDGTAFIPYATMTNIPGWRMLSAPVSNFPLENLSAFTAIQGVENNDFTANLYTSYDGTEWVKPNAISESHSAGSGFILYFYNNSNAGSTPLPITLRASGVVPNTDVTINLHTNGNKYNLIGNPFNATIDWSQISVNSGVLTSTVGQIWDPELGDYFTTTSVSDKVAAWQGLMLENNTAASITVPISAISTGGALANGDVLAKKSQENREVYQLIFTNNETQAQSNLFVVFDENASEAIDELDAKKLYPLHESTKLFSLMSSLENVENQSYSQLAFPFYNEESVFSIVESGSFEGEMSLKIQQKVGVQSERSFHVFDTETNQEIELNAGQECTFSAKKQETIAKKTAQALVMTTSGTKRFLVKINSGNLTSTRNENEGFKNIELHQNFPNPFNPSTEIKFRISSVTSVILSIYTVLGEKIIDLENGIKEAGLHKVSFDATNLSSGLYLYRLEAGNTVLTRKMLLIK